MKKIISWIFYGNIFYGICGIALSIEGSLQQSFPINSISFYLFIFCTTLLYYLLAYLSEQSNGDKRNSRLIWYQKNRKAIITFALLLTVILFMISISLILKCWQNILHLNFFNGLLLSIFPITGLCYYGINHKSVKRLSLRNIGWLKPFVIGFCWAGLVTIYPVFYYCLEHNLTYQVSALTVLLFIKNFMFISMLSILFDIKDYATDSNRLLKTFIVKIGLRRTIFFIIIPLSLLGLGSFIIYGSTHQFSLQKMLLNSLPFIALIMVAWSMQRRKSIFYYLIVIDGLMLLKAICGLVAKVYF